jgi:hypothetical protein
MNRWRAPCGNAALSRLRGGVVALDRRAAGFVHGRDHGGALGQRALRELAFVEQNALRGLLVSATFEARAWHVVMTPVSPTWPPDSA